MTSHDKLDRLASDMKQRGEEGLRLRAVERARNFKRTWVEMAEVLVKVRARQSYLDWGFEDFYDYCGAELQLKRATVDKLTGSYVALERHAPAVLQHDGLAQNVPTCDAVDYFAKALRGDAANDGESERPSELPAEVVDELRHAVFEENAPVAALRRRFDPILKPTSDEERRVDVLKKVSSTARKLAEQVIEVEGLDADLVANVDDALVALRGALDALSADIEAPRRARRAS
jgi:hypothetical protein